MAYDFLNPDIPMVLPKRWLRKVAKDYIIKVTEYHRIIKEKGSTKDENRNLTGKRKSLI